MIKNILLAALNLLMFILIGIFFYIITKDTSSFIYGFIGALTGDYIVFKYKNKDD